MIGNITVFSDSGNAEGIYRRFEFIGCFLAAPQDHALSDGNVLRHNGLVHNGSVAHHRIPHYNRIPDHTVPADHHVRSDDGMVDFPVNLGAFSDKAAVCNRVLRYVLRRDNVPFRVDLPEFLIKIEFRYDIDQFHIGLPVGAQSSHILPISVVLIGKKPLPLLFAVGQDVLAEITVGLILQCNKGFPQDRPAEDIDSHGGKITAGIRRLLLELRDPPGLVCHHDAETAGLLNGNRHARYGDIGFIRLMKIQHNLIIHLIDMISGKDQHIIRMILFHIIDILEDCVRCARIPFTVRTLLIRRKNGNSTLVPVQIPRNADPDMRIQTQRLILCQDSYRIDTGINAVAQGKIYNTIFPAKSDSRFRNLLCQHTKSAALTACQKHSDHFFLDHRALTPCML